MNRNNRLVPFTAAVVLLALSIAASPLDAQRPMQAAPRGTTQSGQEGTPMLLPGGALAVWVAEEGALVLRRLAVMQLAGGPGGDDRPAPPDLREEDRLRSIQGRIVTTGPELFGVYKGIPAGDTVRLTVERDGVEVPVVFPSPGATMVTAPSEDFEARPSGAPTGGGWTGSAAAESPTFAIGGYELAAVRGGVEVVLELSDPMNEGIGLIPGDLIVAAAGRPVREPADVLALWAKLRPGESVEITVRREGARRTVRAKKLR